MADRGDTHYHVPTLNLWFLGSSAFFLLTMVWTVVDDWDAEWKNYQRDFQELELEMARAEAAELERRGALETEEELRNQVEAAREAVTQREDELEEAREEAFVLKEERFVAEEAFKRAKSVLGWETFKAEREVLERKKKAEDPERFDADWMEQELLAPYVARVNERQLEFERADAAYRKAEERVARLEEEVIEAEAALSAGTRDMDQVREKIESLDPSAVPEQVANVVRDFPGLDFIDPTLEVQKYVLEDITFNLNFTTKPRIDMCTTCHMGIDREGFEDAPQPHTSHPRLDLFLSSKSPHPIKEVGCTVCHRGSGESLTFQHVDHRPSDEEEAEEWHEEYHWHKQHYWDYPMLREENVEAGCVQCHTTSMELIAEDAPTVFRGYELFEAKGCYSCHKVEWFPTERKPGPTLKNLAAKLEPDFVYSWISRPRDFRPKTHMPQVFHLSNIDAEEVVTVAEYGGGEPILGQRWNETAVAAITRFLFANHPEQPLPPIPDGMEGDAERGREVMNLTSCFACHNTAPFDEAGAQPPLLSNRVTGQGHGMDRNEMGPNLRGVATKVTKEWLYHWLVDPKSYWPDTRMPDPRLTEQDALDVATYIMEDPDGVFHDVPDEWTVDSEWDAALDPYVLKEQARWFFQKEGRDALETKLEDGEWADTDVLAAQVGEALVRNHGCFSCHMIGGLEDAMPIGTELTTWGTKTVDKLDFGQHYLEEIRLPKAFAAANDIEDRTLEKLDKHYREGWLERKLAHPRSYDIDKVKSPKDRLRMPWFDFSEEEIHALSTFVLGLVEDEVGQAVMQPTAEQLAMDTGMRAVRQNNCKSCHMVDPPTVTYRTEEGEEVTVPGEITQLFLDDPLPPRMSSMEALMADVEESEFFAGEEVEEVGVRLLEVDPDHGLPSEKVFVPRDDLVGVTPGEGGEFVRNVSEYYRLGSKHLPNPDHDPDDPDSGQAFWPATLGWDEDAQANLIEDVDGEMRAYGGEQYDKLRWTFAPPVLWNEGHKAQADWFYAFLKDPYDLREQLRVKMPKFHYEPGEAEAIANYFAAKSRWEWHARYARTLRATLGREVTESLEDGSTEHAWDLDEAARSWPRAGLVTSPGVLPVEELATRTQEDAATALSARTIAAIEAGGKADTEASFHKLKAFGDAVGFDMTGPVKRGHELVRRRTPTYLAAHAGLRDLGQSVAVEGVNCYQCHPNPDAPYEGLDPITWAPSLESTRTRLREEWVREWLWNPMFEYPGTAMPANFSAPEPQYQEQYPGSTNAEQIEAVLSWLYNMDRPSSQ